MFKIIRTFGKWKGWKTEHESVARNRAETSKEKRTIYQDKGYAMVEKQGEKRGSEIIAATEIATDIEEKRWHVEVCRQRYVG